MAVQNYCMINQENVCDNVCVWDGDTVTWQPPAGYTMLVQETTPCMVWVQQGTDFVLQEQIGQGAIGFTWDGTYLTTNQPKPTYVPSIPAIEQPDTTGLQTV